MTIRYTQFQNRKSMVVQASISLGKTKDDTQLLIGKLEQVTPFFDAVAAAIQKGELDGPIGKLQAEKSAALKGK